MPGHGVDADRGVGVDRGVGAGVGVDRGVGAGFGANAGAGFNVQLVEREGKPTAVRLYGALFGRPVVVEGTQGIGGCGDGLPFPGRKLFLKVGYVKVSNLFDIDPQPSVPADGTCNPVT